jgi:type IV pilus assembly protein PilA
MKKIAKGFTLIELMIVVAIIGILAAIAIPNFVKYQLRSKFSEASSNIEGLRKAEEALRQGERRIVVASVVDAGYAPGQYWDMQDNVLPGGAGTPVGTAKLNWTPAEIAIANSMDWQVEGATYFQYQVSTANCPGVPSVGNAGVCYTVGARADIDGDGGNGQVALGKPATNGTEAADPVTAAFPGTAAAGSMCVNGANTIYGTPCTVTGPDVF